MNKLNSPLLFQHIAPFLIIIVLSALAFIFNDSLITLFEYHRQQVSSGQYWRLWSSHLFHTNLYHLLLNLGGLLLLWGLHGERYTLLNTSLNYLFIAGFIALGITLFSPQLSQYVGLSGLLHGLFIWGACGDIKLGRKTGYAMILGAGLKVGHEQIYGPDAQLGQAINATVAIDAHLYGLIAGFICFAIERLYHYKFCSNNR